MAIPPRPVNSGYTDQMLWRISKQLERLINVTGQCNTTTTTTTAP
jgi:hypothetical protein